MAIVRGELLRYYDAHEIGVDGYPWDWDRCWCCQGAPLHRALCEVCKGGGSIKGLVRVLAGHRCIRCHHPYRTGEHPMEQEDDGNGNVVYVSWSPCDERCTHRGPARFRVGKPDAEWFYVIEKNAGQNPPLYSRVDARWRVLTVHHLDGDKANCRWWNLAALCQRCHLTIQGKVRMDRPYDKPHTEWFQPYAAGFYAYKYLGEDLSRDEVTERMEELLLLELRQERLFS